MNAQTRVCACQLRLHFFPVARRCPRSFKETASSGGPIPRCSGPIRTKDPGCVGHRHLRSVLPSARPHSEDPGPLDRCLQCVPSRLLGSSIDFWQRSGVGAATLARASTTQRAWSSTTHGALAHMEHVPFGARALALLDKPRTPRLLGCHPGRHGGAFRPRVPSLAS